MKINEGDIACVEGLDEWILEIEVPDNGVFFIDGRAIVTGESTMKIFVDDKIVGISTIGDLPGYNGISVVKKMEGEPGTKVIVSMELTGVLAARPTLLVTKNKPWN